MARRPGQIGLFQSGTRSFQQSMSDRNVNLVADDPCDDGGLIVATPQQTTGRQWQGNDAIRAMVVDESRVDSRGKQRAEYLTLSKTVVKLERLYPICDGVLVAQRCHGSLTGNRPSATRDAPWSSQRLSAALAGVVVPRQCGVAEVAQIPSPVETNFAEQAVVRKE